MSFRFVLTSLLLREAFVLADLPTELDPFLEKLFEFSQCEEFVSNAEFVSVATRECSPHLCDFPRQICQRPASEFRDPSSNQCKSIPEECVTAANGGVALPSPTRGPILVTIGPQGHGLGGTTEGPPPKVDLEDLCQMEPPVGRFCGFVRMFTYNRETGHCDQFWFPGCKTRETNANLFDSHSVCEQLALLCRERLRPSTTTSSPFLPPFSPLTLAPNTVEPPRPTYPPRIVRPPQPPPSRPTEGGGGGGGGGGVFGLESGNGEFGNNIVSLIAQGLMGARGGRPLPTPAGGRVDSALNVLSQFTNFEFGNLPSLLGGGGLGPSSRWR